MWNFIFLCTFMWTFSLQSELWDLLSATDEFFSEFHFSEPSDAENLKLMLKRSYNLDDGTENRRFKRSIEHSSLFRDKKGVYMLSNIEDVVKIPVRFPNDINILSAHNLLYITSLEANGSNPGSQLANDLVLFQYSSIQGIKEMGRVPVLGGTKLALHSFQNVTYIIAAERDANSALDSFQGSAVYTLSERSGRIYLEKIQILSVVQPNDVKFWEHQDQLYLVVATNKGNDTLRSGTLIYRWLGYHFDCLQVIPTKNVKAVTSFTIGSFMYLAVANFQDEYGNVDIDSDIFLFNIHDMKFKKIQTIKTHGANDISYFKFEDPESKESEHFLIVANSLSRNPDRSLNSQIESVVYKFDENIFIPFQSFKLTGATQWLPIKGSNEEFLLLAAHSFGVIGYQYDGWRFSEISLHFGQSPFGDNIQSMRAFQYFGDLFLTVADKSSYGNKINLWKLTFSNKNDLEKRYKQIQDWCDGMNKELNGDNFEEVMNEYKNLLVEDQDDPDGSLHAGNLKLEDFNQEVHDKVVHLSEDAEKLKKLVKDAEKDVEILKNDSEVPIMLGSSEIASLEVKCVTQNCCTFKNLKVVRINGEDFAEFTENIVLLDENISESMIEFEHVVVDDDLSSSTVNGHPSDTLIDVSSTTFINSGLAVNGTVIINGDLRVDGLFNEILPDENYFLMKNESQNFEDTLWVDNLKVKNLKLSGEVNGETVENLMRQPEINLDNTYKELNVNNINVEGLVNGYNLTQIFSDVSRNSENLEINGDLEVNSLEADEIIVESNEIFNRSISEILEAYNERLCETVLESEAVDQRSVQEDSEEHFGNEKTPEQFIIIVEGFLKVNDISDLTNSLSLLDILKNGYKLDETVIDSSVEFSDVVAGDFQVDFVNNVSVDSWVLKNSDKEQHIYGKKKFLKGFHVQKEVFLDTINGIDLEKLARDTLKLDGDQVISADLKFDTVTCHEIEVNSAFFGDIPFEQMGRLELRESISADRIQVGNLTLTGGIDSLSWSDIVESSVYSIDDIVTGEKILSGSIHVKNLNVSGKINDLLFEEFMAMTSKDANKILLDRNVTLNSSLSVDELHFEGFLDSTLQSDFEHEWLLQDETQIITKPVTFENVEMKSAANLMNETVNNISLRKLFTKSLKVNEDTKIKYLFTMDKIRAERLDIGGTLNGVDFNDSVVQSRSKTPQYISGEWFLNNGLIVNGSLIVDGYVSGMNVSYLCGLKDTDKFSLIVGGSVQLKQEPKIKGTVNGINLTEKSREIWIKTEDTTFKAQGMEFDDLEIQSKSTLEGYLNGVNLTEISKYYLSKTQNRVISSDFEFDQLVIMKWCRMHKARVGGTVNGVDLAHWSRNVLLQDEEQTIWEQLRFEIFETSDLKLEGTVNGVDLSKDVLRLDVENAVVEGEKTFQAINVVNLTLPKGKTLQGVDVDSWRESLVRNGEEVVIKGDLTLKDAAFNGPLIVNGKVNDINFDSHHLLTTNGNQVVTAYKIFDVTDHPNETLKISYLNVSGLINGINLDDLIENQAYSDRNLLFSQPITLTKGLNADSMEVNGLFHGVNISGICNDVFNPVDVNSKKNDFYDLLNKTKTLLKVVEDRAFFFDYFESIQTLKPNIKDVVPILNRDGKYLLAVFASDMMRFMEWNDYSESFVNTDDGLKLADYVTFVTSETSGNTSYLFIESTKGAKIFESELLKEIESTNTSCVASFHLKQLDKSCLFIGQKRNSSRILCNSFVMNDLQTYQWLDSEGSVQVSVLTIDDDVYIAVINKEKVFDRSENTLSIYRFDPKLQHFYVTHTLAEVNPVALSSISYKNDHYLVSAGGHMPESVHNSVLSIFKFNKHYKVFMRSQSIRVDTPVDVKFDLLPSSELALYVLTSNPTKPFVVFLHKGISGFVEETSGFSLYSGSNLYSFTDSSNRHFVLISGFGRGQILKAEFKGNKSP